MTIPPPLPSPSLMVCYAEAQAALARLEERLRLSPVRQPLKARMALAERQALASIDMADLPEEAVIIDGRGRLTTSVYDLTHWKHAIGMPITLNALATDASALLQWFGVDMRQPSQNATGHRETCELASAVEAWSKACNALPPSPALLHSGRIAALWRQHSPLGRGDVVASLLLGDRWGPGRWNGSQGGLTALGLKLAGGRWKVARGTELDRLLARRHRGRSKRSSSDRSSTAGLCPACGNASRPSPASGTAEGPALFCHGTARCYER